MARTSEAEKSAIKANRMKFLMHVAMIMEDAECSKADATILAYHEGRAGLAARRNPAGVPK